MKNMLRPIFAAIIAAALMAASSVPSEAVARAPLANAYDGQWSVVIYTLRGDCDRALRYSLQIVGGQVQTQNPGYQAAGMVQGSGAIRVVVRQGGRYASGSGRLSGNRGRGYWRIDHGQCSGQWTAERRLATD
jgi:hypothetical protein